MVTFNDIPEWLIKAMFGGVSAVIGFFAKPLWDWWHNRHETKKQRVQRLEKLKRLLTESNNLFISQNSQARRLVERIYRSGQSNAQQGSSFEKVISGAFQTLSEDDRQLHSIIRGVTETAIRRVNADMAIWIENDDYFSMDNQKSVLCQNLSKQLEKLQLHLNQWESKFLSDFQGNRSLALNYLGDETGFGIPFPKDIDSLVKEVLKEMA